jgi:hypothetical protein
MNQRGDFFFSKKRILRPRRRALCQTKPTLPSPPTDVTPPDLRTRACGHYADKAGWLHRLHRPAHGCNGCMWALGTMGTWGHCPAAHKEPSAKSGGRLHTKSLPPKVAEGWGQWGHGDIAPLAKQTIVILRIDSKVNRGQPWTCWQSRQDAPEGPPAISPFPSLQNAAGGLLGRKAARLWKPRPARFQVG